MREDKPESEASFNCLSVYLIGFTLKILTKNELHLLKQVIDSDPCTQHNAIVHNIDQSRRYELWDEDILDYNNDIDEIEHQKCHNISSDERWFITDSFISELE